MAVGFFTSACFKICFDSLLLDFNIVTHLIGFVICRGTKCIRGTPSFAQIFNFSFERLSKRIYWCPFPYRILKCVKFLDFTFCMGIYLPVWAKVPSWYFNDKIKVVSKIWSTCWILYFIHFGFHILYWRLKSYRKFSPRKIIRSDSIIKRLLNLRCEKNPEVLSLQ